MEATGMRLPDFLIVGAMKAGTTSLHRMLSMHERVILPEPELFFFCLDDVQQHPDFFVSTKDGWTSHNYEDDFHELLAWYASFFPETTAGQLVGERSTTYMSSRRAPRRIARLLPDAKLIFMLRDPVDRIYSQYWHELRMGRAVFDFEGALQYTPGVLFERGHYREQILRYQESFSASRLLFVLFESFVQDAQSVIDQVCRFLNLDLTLVMGDLDTRHNPARVPLSTRLQIAHNRVFRGRAARIFLNSYLPGMESSDGSSALWLAGRVLRRANYAGTRSYPPMKPETREFLEKVFSIENRGLSDVIGVDLRDYWPWMQS